jgi:hypothetical protein
MTPIFHNIVDHENPPTTIMSGDPFVDITCIIVFPLDFN